MTATFTDVERPVRDWLRGAGLSVDDRVYIGVPARATFPLIAVDLFDGGVLPGEAPLAASRFTFSAWGDSPTADREQLAGIAWELVALLQGTDYANLTSLVLLGAVILTGPTPRYDPDRTPRYQLDAALTLRIAT